MKQVTKRIMALLLVLVLSCGIAPQIAAAPAGPSETKVYTDPTGYTSAGDVVYKIVSGTVANWGARGEDCTFLTTYAQDFYTGSYTFENLSKLDGSKYQDSVPSTELYAALKTLMSSKHTTVQSYNATREYYQYTDCLKNETSKLSTFYTGKLVNSAWDGGKTYNREHCWPSSKCLYTNHTNDGADIMMLRPESPNDNSSRGNKGYGESDSFFDPGVSVRGDCARLLLYGYVRWGNTSKMWGSSGVIENINILFKWMEEDPVDTWEMGRNDAVQSITGTRNVFVDYPELAYLMFARTIPSTMTTPSGNAGSTACQHTNTEVRNAKTASCSASGYTGDTYCKDCGAKVKTGTTIPATSHTDANNDLKCDVCSSTIDCPHAETELKDAEDATCCKEGYTGDECCTLCGDIVLRGEVIPKTTEHAETVINAKDATCCGDGYTGDTVCLQCNESIRAGEVIPAGGEHTFGDWTVTKNPTATEDGEKQHICTVGGFTETEVIPAGTDITEPSVPAETQPTDNQAGDDTDPAPKSPVLWIIIGILAAGGVTVAVILILKKKK